MSGHAVIANLALSAGEFGSRNEREVVRALEQSIERVLDAAGAGELDGNEFGGGEAVLYMYGPNADLLFSAVEPVLRQSTLRPAYVILRYGEVGDQAARERRIDL